MNSPTSQKTFRSGREALEHYIPDYVAPEVAAELRQADAGGLRSPEEIKAALLSGLKARLDGLELGAKRD